MSTNDFFSKDVLCNIIEGNLDILHRCINGTIYQQWTAVVLLMQFIEYLLKYKIQCAGKRFDPIHPIKELYSDLMDDDQNDIEERFCKLMKDRKPPVPGSFDSIEEFARRYNTAYQFWRYGIPTNSDQVSQGRSTFIWQIRLLFFVLLLKVQTWRLIFRLFLTRVNWRKKY